MKKTGPAGKLRSLQIIPLLLIILLLSSCSGGRQSFSFIQLTDPQLGMGGYEHDVASLNQAVKQINEMEVDFVIFCGDLVHHASDSSFADFLQISAQLEVPYYVVPGNHDVGLVPDDTTLSGYRVLFGDDYYTFDHKGTTFVFTNTQLWKSDIGEASDMHDKWFRSTLENVKNKNRVVVVGHYPLFIKTPGEEEIYSNLPQGLRVEILDLFEKNNVAAYLTGHRHEFIQHNYQGIQLVTAETTSKNFDGRPLGFRRWDVSRDTLIHHFIEIEPVTASIND
jgi:3',5'-cyclic AMP phosphodiesterase CpdA